VRNERDKLLGPSAGTTGHGQQPRRFWLLLALLALVAGVFAWAAYEFGRRSSVPVQSTPVIVVPPKAAQSPSAPSTTPAIEPPKPTQPELRLATIKDGDWKKIGMGCSCSFTQGVPRKELLIAGGDGVALFKPNGNSRVCTLREEQTQEMFDGETTIKCGQSRVHIKTFGEVEPGFDGHSSKARMTVIDNGQELELTGTFGCGC
jgi:hypothetical protein